MQFSAHSVDRNVSDSILYATDVLPTTAMVSSWWNAKSHMPSSQSRQMWVIETDLKCWSQHFRGVAGAQEESMNSFGMHLKAVV
jgi:hypothetical protein